MDLKNIRWGRIVVAALAGELLPVVALVAYVFLYSVTWAEPGLPEEHYQQFAERAGDFFGPVGGAIATFFAAVWACRPLGDRFLLHGTLVGVLVALIGGALLLAAAAPFRWIFLASYAVKLAAGVGGGRVAGRRFLRATTS